jgi:molybdate transport system ATP-binding protein
VLRLEAQLPLRSIELDLRLEVKPGETLALAGASGAGKTTCLRVIAGLARPLRGRVDCGGDIWLDTEHRISLPPEQRRCGFLFQEYALFPHLRAWQNVAYGLADLPRGQRRARAHELLERFGLEGLADALPRRLSGGERQRVALARALARRPRALLLDEPLSALDPATRAGAARELAAVLAEAGVPALLVTHDFEQASLLGDRVAVLDRGRIAQMGSPEELVASPRSASVADFTGAVVLHGVARPGVGGLTAVQLAGGGLVSSTDAGEGPVSVTVHPWEIAVEPRPLEHGEARSGSAQNRLPARVSSITELGNRVRVGLLAPEPITAELTRPAVESLRLAPGSEVVATWKATATRLVPRHGDRPR